MTTADVFVDQRRNGSTAAGRSRRRTGASRAVPAVLDPWLVSQATNVRRHAGALRPFERGEFGTGPAAPSEGHIAAANALIEALRRPLIDMTGRVREAVELARTARSTAALQQAVVLKERAHHHVRAVEQVWDFYFELFGQRQSRFGEWLLGCDRIAQDCYQAAFRGVGAAKSVPAPPPFSYMRTGFSPATYRRGVPLRRLGQRRNPFPLVQLPYHRLVNPWTLGAVLHEVSHNLHNDLGIADAVPHRILRQLERAGCPRPVAATWARWNREIFADLSGLLLGGPMIVGSLMDVIGRSPAATTTYSATGPHPTPVLRPMISTEALRRLGFADDADNYARTWQRIYPNPMAGNVPRPLLATFDQANAIVVDAICFQPFAELGGRSLAEVFRFEAKDQAMIEEAARRLAAGNDPGIVPERFMIGAARLALYRGYARPGAIARGFYRELARR